MRTTKVITDGGNPMAFPRTSTHAAGTQIANQDTTFTGTDPVLGSMTLNAYDFGELLAVGNDLLEDSGTDVLGWVASQLGRAIGQVTATGYVTGSGSNTIQGIQGAIGGAGTIATGGSLIIGPAGAEVEKLTDPAIRRR
jgi:HK97 family phage major capsid protein